jgi:hypothetical protein
MHWLKAPEEVLAAAALQQQALPELPVQVPRV